MWESAVGKLTNTALKSALNRPGRHGDGGGLSLMVSKPGTGSWVARVQKDGRRRDIGLGGYPAVSLAMAREQASLVRAQLAAGRDPVAERRKAAGIPTFEEAARIVHDLQRKRWRPGKHADQWINSLRDHAFPAIGAIRLNAVSVADISNALTRIWLDRPETARRVFQRIRMILDWGYAQGYREAEAPVRAIRQGLPRQTGAVRHHSAMPFADVPAFFGSLKERENVSRLALAFLILTATRSQEIRGARWGEVDFEKALWTVPAERMKMGIEHVVPLSAPAIAVLKRMLALRTPDAELIFPGLKKGRPLSDMALTRFLREQGLNFTAHGFRSSFRDWASETTDYPGEVAEAALAHTVQSKSERAYRRGNLLPKRRAMMGDWATYCCGEAAHGEA